MSEKNLLHNEVPGTKGTDINYSLKGILRTTKDYVNFLRTTNKLKSTVWVGTAQVLGTGGFFESVYLHNKFGETAKGNLAVDVGMFLFVGTLASEAWLISGVARNWNEFRKSRPKKKQEK